MLTRAPCIFLELYKGRNKAVPLNRSTERWWKSSTRRCTRRLRAPPRISPVAMHSIWNQVHMT